MCKKYDYAAIGGVASKEAIIKYQSRFKQLNLMARQYGCKLHGLGFTPLQDTEKYGFYSTDSTTWKTGGVFGRLTEFQQDRLVDRHRKEKGKRIVSREVIHRHNFIEWLKYQKYLDIKE